MRPLETIGPESTLTEVLESVSQAGRIFEVLEIDRCCAEGASVAKAAEAAGVDPDELLELLHDDDSPLHVAATPPGFADSSLRSQIEHIVGVHHRYTRRQLLRLDRRMSRLRSGHRRTVAWLDEVAGLLQELIDDLIPHMAREERYLFPYCISLEEEMKPDVRIVVPLFGNLDYPLASITDDHADDSRRLMEMRRLTSGFQPEPDSCRTLRRFLEGLAQLERAVQEHIRIENRIVFPKAKARERAARNESAPGPA
ncbi:MAG TPA: hemerythrin domain-containing protein [Longimicrobiaceae bacterium]|nr:hemerythrin domain-containing protein [Longimicrobiaceae bacterium]